LNILVHHVHLWSWQCVKTWLGDPNGLITCKSCKRRGQIIVCWEDLSEEQCDFTVKDGEGCECFVEVMKTDVRLRRCNVTM
jgi:hypothetical protein